MSENPQPADPDHDVDAAGAHPHDPFAARPASEGPTDPYAHDARPQDDSSTAAGSTAAPSAPAFGAADAEPGSAPHGTDAPTGSSAPYSSDAASGSDQPLPSGAPYAAGAQPSSGAQPNPSAQPNAGEWSNVPPAGTPGVFDGPLTGQPVSESDAKTWAMLGQLSVVIGHATGLFGWLGPLIVYLMYKDRNRFVRFHAAEALNGAIATVLASIVLVIATGILTIVTFGIGGFLIPLAGLPQLLHIIFSIIGAVKANDRQWWPYPLNIRFLR